MTDHIDLRDQSQPVGPAAGPLPLEQVRRLVRSGGLTAPSAARSGGKLALLLAAWAGAAALAVSADVPWAWALCFAVGVVVSFSLTFAQHEATHGLLFRRPLANHVLGSVCGALVLTPFACYRLYHLQHHSHTRVPGDSEPATVARSRLEYAVGAPAAIPLVGASLWAELARLTLGRRPRWAPAAHRRGPLVLTLVVSAAVTAAMAVLAAVHGWHTLVIVWIGPVLVMAVLASFVAIPEHYGAAYGPADAFSTTRTIDTGRLMGWIIWNENLHTAHHWLPTVPGHRLPELQRLIDDRCRVRVAGYLRFHRDQWQQMTAGRFPPPPPWEEDGSGASRPPNRRAGAHQSEVR